MARWHVDNEAFQLPTGHSLERFCHDGVVPARNEARPHLFDVLKELCLAPLTSPQLLQVAQLGQQQLLLAHTQLGQDTWDVFEGYVVQIKHQTPRPTRT